MTAAIVFAIAFVLTVATVIGIAQPRTPRRPDAVDYAAQGDRMMRAAAKAREVRHD